MYLYLSIYVSVCHYLSNYFTYVPSSNYYSINYFLQELEAWLVEGRKRMDELLNPSGPIEAEERVLNTMQLGEDIRYGVFRECFFRTLETYYNLAYKRSLTQCECLYWLLIF